MTSADESQLDQADLSLSGYNGEPTPMRTLYFDQSPVMGIHLTVSPDRMQAFIKLVPAEGYVPIDKRMITELLNEFGVVSGIDSEALEFFVLMQNTSSPFTGYFQLARGEQPRNGEDGYLEFHVQPSAAVPRYDQDDSGGIDYKQLNLIENCFAGQRVASIIPPGAGRPGMDVFGEEIPPRPGDPVRTRPGPGVLISSTGRDFNSDIEGRLVYEGDVLSVSPLLEIAHDVDYSVGNIDFVGTVQVNGSILDGFSVKGKKGVNVRGDVGSSVIISEGDVSITGGVSGKSMAHIECAALSARYIDNATVEATGGVTVDKEILHSDVRSLGKVSILNGSIVGGEVWGFEGIEAANIGSELGVQTSIVSGLSWTDENVLAEVRGKVAENSERVKSAGILLEQLLDTPNLSAQLSLDQKSMISDLIAELRILRDGLALLVEEKDRIVNRRHAGRVCQINVAKNLYMGVKVRFTVTDGVVKDAVKGPLSIVQDENRNSFRIAKSFPLTPERERDDPNG